jgi:hypothetical protein
MVTIERLESQILGLELVLGWQSNRKDMVTYCVKTGDIYQTCSTAKEESIRENEEELTRKRKELKILKTEELIKG